MTYNVFTTKLSGPQYLGRVAWTRSRTRNHNGGRAAGPGLRGHSLQRTNLFEADVQGMVKIVPFLINHQLLRMFMDLKIRTLITAWLLQWFPKKGNWNRPIWSLLAPTQTEWKGSTTKRRTAVKTWKSATDYSSCWRCWLGSTETRSNLEAGWVQRQELPWCQKVQECRLDWQYRQGTFWHDCSHQLPTDLARPMHIAEMDNRRDIICRSLKLRQ